MKKKNTITNTSSGSYEIYVDCENCDERNNIIISRGNLIIDVDCPNCGNKTLKRVK